MKCSRDFLLSPGEPLCCITSPVYEMEERIRSFFKRSPNDTLANFQRSLPVPCAYTYIYTERYSFRIRPPGRRHTGFPQTRRAMQIFAGRSSGLVLLLHLLLSPLLHAVLLGHVVMDTVYTPYRNEPTERERNVQIFVIG